MTIDKSAVPVVLALAGLLLYLAPLPGKANECGRILFFCGLLAWLMRT